MQEIFIISLRLVSYPLASSAANYAYSWTISFCSNKLIGNYCVVQSTICVKQLAYAILEMSLVSIFPELRDLVLDIHEKMHVDQTVQ